MVIVRLYCQRREGLYLSCSADSIGDYHKWWNPNKPRRLKLVGVLKTRALAGKGPFEALARGGCGISHPHSGGEL